MFDKKLNSSANSSGPSASSHPPSGGSEYSDPYVGSCSQNRASLRCTQSLTNLVVSRTSTTTSSSYLRLKAGSKASLAAEEAVTNCENNKEAVPSVNAEKTKNTAKINGTPTGIGSELSGTVDAGVRDDARTIFQRSKDSFRLYSGNVIFDAKIGGKHFSDVVDVYYRVGPRNGPTVVLQSPTMQHRAVRYPQKVKMGVNLANDFQNYSTKYSAFSAEHSYMDMSALIEQLGAALCVYAERGELRAEWLSANRSIKLVALQQHATGCVPSTNCIFVPRCVDTELHPSTFCAILHAASACGATVVTDVVGVDVVTNKGYYNIYNDAALVAGCYDALRIIGGMYEACDAGDVFSLALTRGVVRALTVVGHTDEGGIMRAVLRAGAYVTPTGGIIASTPKITGIPQPGDTSVGSYRKVTDALALLIAGYVAEADPGMVVNGKVIPTTFSHIGDDVNDSECHEHNHYRLQESMPKFAPRYIKCLNAIFNVNGNSGLATSFLNFSANLDVVARDRHLAGRIMCPFYWIEPTCVVPKSIEGASNPAVGSGAMVYYDEMKTEGLLGSHEVTSSWVHEYEVTLDYTNLRSSPLLRWLSMRRDDGLALIDISACDPDLFLMTGPNIRGGAIGASATDLTRLSELRWKSGDNCVPKPGEALYIGDGLSLLFHWISAPVKSEGGRPPYAYKLNALPKRTDLMASTITISCSNLVEQGWSDIGSYAPGVQKRVTRGARAIAAAWNVRAMEGAFNRAPTFTRGDVKLSQRLKLARLEAVALVEADSINTSRERGGSVALTEHQVGTVPESKQTRNADNTFRQTYVPEVARAVRGGETQVVGVSPPDVTGPVVGDRDESIHDTSGNPVSTGTPETGGK